jgi:hypothetical protein
VAEQQILHANLARAHIVESELRQRIRLAGIGSMAEVRAVILERNGAISVIRSGTPVDTNMLDDVVGHEAFISGHPERESDVTASHAASAHLAPPPAAPCGDVPHVSRRVADPSWSASSPTPQE